MNIDHQELRTAAASIKVDKIEATIEAQDLGQAILHLHTNIEAVAVVALPEDAEDRQTAVVTADEFPPTIEVCV